MFHQVRVKPEDCEAMRFLWWPGGNIDQDTVDHKIFVYLFGATSLPSCCSYALRKTAEDNQGYFSEKAIETVHNNYCHNQGSSSTCWSTPQVTGSWWLQTDQVGLQ